MLCKCLVKIRFALNVVQQTGSDKTWRTKQKEERREEGKKERKKERKKKEGFVL